MVSSENAFEPAGRRRRRGSGCGALEPFGDFWRHVGLPGVEAQQFFGGGKFVSRRLCLMRFNVLLFLRKFGSVFHRLQAVLLKCAANALRARCSFPRTASAVWPTSVAISS